MGPTVVLFCRKEDDRESPSLAIIQLRVEKQESLFIRGQIGNPSPVPGALEM